MANPFERQILRNRMSVARSGFGIPAMYGRLDGHHPKNSHRFYTEVEVSRRLPEPAGTQRTGASDRGVHQCPAVERSRNRRMPNFEGDEACLGTTSG
jgi:hypothetical protein